MPKGVSIQVEGLDKLKKKLGAIPENVKFETDALLSSVAKNYEERAVNDAPKFDLALTGSISSGRVAEMEHEVVAPVFYAAYVEFGTKNRFKAIPGIDSSQFKGSRGGTVTDLFTAILNWVKKKGIASRWSLKTHKPIKPTKNDIVNIQETAAAIAISILRHGINPHPFFFKQLPIAQEEVKSEMKEVINRALAK